jgi:hypothetical protein
MNATLLDGEEQADQLWPGADARFSYCAVAKIADRIRRMITKGVKLMVAENSIGPVTADHRAGDLQHLANCRAAVDEIADKNRIATFGDVATVSLFVAELSKQSP